MANEEFQKTMADLREREKRLNGNLAALEEESRAYARDHRELLLAIERDQGPTRPPQHPVAEALNTFHSTQVVLPSAVVSGAEAQPTNDEDSLFVPEDPRVDESTAVDPPRPKRRVTFSDAPATILGGMTPSQHQEAANIHSTNEPAPVQSLPNDVNMGYNQPVYTGERRPVKRARHSFRTPALMPCPGFTPISSEDGPVNTPDQSLPVPVTSSDTNMGVDKPIYTGDWRPLKRARHPFGTSKLMLNTGFTPILPDNKPTLDPPGCDFVGTYNPDDFSTYDPSIPAVGPIEPFQSAEFDHMDAETDEFVPNFVCPYPDCWKLYVTSDDVEEHLKHDHPDWALIKDTVIDPNSM